ncbi:Ltp family lipoprotein [Ligilactobacillus salivarius]|uniref:Ltp family lipoprotein n=1 Tax=Ligilactobacillus salivarius TaxID=1624 RepID=UPI003C2F74B8
MILPLRILMFLLMLAIAYFIFRWNKNNSGKKRWYALAIIFALASFGALGDTPKSRHQEAVESSKAESSSIKESERKESISIEEDAKSSSLSEKKASSIKAKQSSENSSKKIQREYVSALIKGQGYADRMYMSKKAIYDQLTSDYGEKFSPEAATYAINNIKADWNKNALHKAKDYQEEQNMSPDAIYDQLTSDSGEQFTPDEANYAIQHLNK